jgi:hypothetical protein
VIFFSCDWTNEGSPNPARINAIAKLPQNFINLLLKSNLLPQLFLSPQKTWPGWLRMKVLT